MRATLLTAFLFVSTALFGQTSFLKAAAAKLDEALVSKDTATLKKLLHNQLTYGHSNGWVQTKSDVLADLSSGKLVYHRIEAKDPTWQTTGNDVATVRSTAEVGYRLEGKEGELKLHVVQVWLKTPKGWQLLTRQSTKL